MLQVAYADSGELEGAGQGGIRVITLPQGSGVGKMEVAYAAPGETGDLGQLTQQGDVRILSLPAGGAVSKMEVSSSAYWFHLIGLSVLFQMINYLQQSITSIGNNCKFFSISDD